MKNTNLLVGITNSGKTKMIFDYLKEIISDIDEGDEIIISELSNIPKGGIKGLLYYKIITARNKGVEVILDTDKNISSYLEKLTSEKNKIVSKVLGVYIDNAIDATLSTNNKTINIEIYILNNKINFVISNKFDQSDLKLEQMGKNGYTTKKNGHGKGLYLVNKLISKISWFSTERKIINEFYIQRIIIDIPKL